MYTTQTRESLPLFSTPAARERDGCDESCGCGGRRLLKKFTGRFAVVAVMGLTSAYAVTAWATGSACLGLCQLIP